MELEKKPRGRPRTGVTPKRNIRVGAVWDEAAAIADTRGETMTEVIEAALRRYVSRNRLALKEPAIERFLARVKRSGGPTESGCWPWSKSPKAKYGVFWFNGHSTGAHRAAHELFIGPIPPRHVVDHLCRNPNCVNPDHLEAVIPQENHLRAPGHPINTGELADSRSPTWEKYVPDWANREES